MTHFTVLVIGEDIEGALAPYDENLEVTPYIHTTKEELEIERKEMIEEAKNPPEGTSIDYSVYKDGMSLVEFVRQYHEQELDKDGNMLTTYNPSSKWDWYEIGGRWKGMLLGKTGIKTDQARLNQLHPDQKTHNIYNNIFYTYAVITQEGVWHEMGKMGWWAYSSETDEKRDKWIKTYRDRFIKGLSGNTLLTVVDCHI
jgi:hypothetical protein